ncbi:helix-turn-helix domain-containing protein [Paenibacillus sacheonensis]|uniref:Helix-turn-helix domain-containing protein n=1 Tax=Paenibacillus sacheonensis TaxID=742054 RepID=A0A7X4YTR0_9BACL|nr:helix-turn-helix domain-containing protein [Paenibacillus sacheonensis]MBM7568530.1 AraC family cel operon transcriptional repressor [Paenibacillus sacheonensis]NBC72355.1 helix-turn-helix domain-containing protein [Paenibacillus sacheonensis]
MLHLKADELIDPELETMFYYHRKLNYWTIVHDHDFYECFLITDGRVHHIVNGVRQLLTEGTLLFIRPHDTHSYERVGEEEAELLNINFRSSMMEQALAYLGEGFSAERLTDAELPPQCTLSREDAAWLIRQYERIQTGAAEGNRQVRSAARGMLIELLDRFFGPPGASSRPDAPAWLNQLLERMKDKSMLAEGVEAFYRLTSYSPEHACRVMKKHYGVSPTDWINDQRLAYAALLLTQGEASILAISLECGYGSLSYFYKTFADRFKQTPAHYRRTHRKTAIPVHGPAWQ